MGEEDGSGRGGPRVERGPSRRGPPRLVRRRRGWPRHLEPATPHRGPRPSPTHRRGDLIGELAQRVLAVLEEQVNPSIAMHGGRADLVAVEEDVVYLRLSGGARGAAWPRSRCRRASRWRCATPCPRSCRWSTSPTTPAGPTPSTSRPRSRSGCRAVPSACGRGRRRRGPRGATTRRLTCPHGRPRHGGRARPADSSSADELEIVVERLGERRPLDRPWWRCPRRARPPAAGLGPRARGPRARPSARLPRVRASAVPHPWRPAVLGRRQRRRPRRLRRPLRRRRGPRRLRRVRPVHGGHQRGRPRALHHPQPASSIRTLALLVPLFVVASAVDHRWGSLGTCRHRRGGGLRGLLRPPPGRAPGHGLRRRPSGRGDRPGHGWLGSRPRLRGLLRRLRARRRDRHRRHGGDRRRGARPGSPSAPFWPPGPS